MDCEIEDCHEPAIARGWCERHYGRWYRTGDPLMVRRPGNKPRSLAARFWERVEKSDGCWYWTGARFASGYGAIGEGGRGGRVRTAHRVAWELLVGPIPDGMTIDHVCHNDDTMCAGGAGCPHRRCVRPDHLRVATSAENTRAGRGGGNFRAGHRAYARVCIECGAAFTSAGNRRLRCNICR